MSGKHYIVASSRCVAMISTYFLISGIAEAVYMSRRLLSNILLKLDFITPIV